MGAPFDDIAFLATSPNRVGVLETLADGPHDRHALQDALDISQPTASRILRDLREREWVVRTGNHYELSPTGELVIAGFADLRAYLDAVHHLGDVLPMFPEEGFDFDLRRLRSAAVVRTAEGERGLARTHEVAHLTAADHVRVLTAFAPRRSVEAVWEQVTEGSQRFELVIESDALTSIRREPELARWHRDMLSSGRAECYRYDGDVVHPLLLTDDTVHLALPGGRDGDNAWISTDDEAILDWAEATFEEHKRTAVALSEADFTP